MTTKEKLDQNIPESAIEQREAWRNGPKLSYLSGAYVINRLNEVLGQGNWSYGIHKMDKVYEGEIEQSSGKAFTVSYITQVWFNANIDGRQVNFIEVGYGDGTDKKSQGKAHELATKESSTDALKRAAKNLGISMGLGLYFKSGEYVDEQQVTQAKPQAVTPASKAANVSKPVTASVESQTASGVLPSDSAKPFTDTKALRAKIKSAFAVLEAQKKVSKKDFVDNYLGGGKVDTISDEQVIKTLDIIKTKHSELGL